MNAPGATLYIIHGWAYSIEPWGETVKHLQDAGVSVVQLRVPGLTSPSDKVWTIDDYVSWLEQELAGVDQPIVLGHSNGGRIAMHYLVRHPGAFRHLILLSSAGIELRSQQLSLKRRVLTLVSKVLASLKHIPGVRRVVYRLLGSDYGSAPPNMQATLRNMLASDRNFDPSSIAVPTSILSGDADRVTPPSMERRLHTLIPNSSYKQLPEWGHAPYRTHARQLADELLTILGGVA